MDIDKPTPEPELSDRERALVRKLIGLMDALREEMGGEYPATMTDKQRETLAAVDEIRAHVESDDAR